MNTRLIVAASCLLVFGCSRPPQLEGKSPSSPKSICSLSKSDYGHIIRVTAVYETDLRHGAFLSDERCPEASIAIGFDAEGVDDTVEKFDQSLYDAASRPGMVRAIVDISGRVETSSEAPAAKPEFRRLHLNSSKLVR